MHTVIIYTVGWVKNKKQPTKQKKKEAQAERESVCVCCGSLLLSNDEIGKACKKRKEKKGIRKLKILKTKKH